MTDTSLMQASSERPFAGIWIVQFGRMKRSPTDIPTGYKHPAIQQQSRGVLLPRIVHIAGESPSSPRGGICTRNTQRCNSQAKEL